MEIITPDTESVMNVMHQGNKNRKTGSTGMNERSSRSHTIFDIVSNRLQ